MDEEDPKHHLTESEHDSLGQAVKLLKDRGVTQNKIVKTVESTSESSLPASVFTPMIRVKPTDGFTRAYKVQLLKDLQAALKTLGVNWVVELNDNRVDVKRLRGERAAGANCTGANNSGANESRAKQQEKARFNRKGLLAAGIAAIGSGLGNGLIGFFLADNDPLHPYYMRGGQSVGFGIVLVIRHLEKYLSLKDDAIAAIIFTLLYGAIMFYWGEGIGNTLKGVATFCGAKGTWADAIATFFHTFGVVFLFYAIIPKDFSKFNKMFD